MAEQPENDRLDEEIADAFGELFQQMVERFEDLARRFSLPAFCVKALHMLGTPMAMKDLGRRFHCDPSFVTAIADTLDSHGLGRRETDTKDRRIKNLLLTPKGMQLRARVERELQECMPWTGALDADERKCLLTLLRKMIGAESERRARDAPAAAPQSSTASATPQAAAGGNRAQEVRQQPTAARSGS
jgi:DNA-binding MarR family transcriptional regulator